MGDHLISEEFQSDKYPDTPRGFVPLKLTDPMAQDLLWEYARRRRKVDTEFSDDLEEALRLKGFKGMEADKGDFRQTKENTQTCGPLFREVYEEALKDSNDPLILFSWGHLAASAEKIWLGACNAAVFRPVTSEVSRFQLRIAIVAEIYGLEWTYIGLDRGTEFWLFTQDSLQSVLLLVEKLHTNSPESHYIRGTLCGIPPEKIDLEFHERYTPSAR